MKTNASREIYSYWNDIRGDRPAPLRGEIDPSQIRQALPDLFVLTDLGDDVPVFRLTGTRLYNLFSRELRDTPFSEMWQPDAALEACRIAKGVLQHERPVIFDLYAESVSGHTSQEFEMLLLPLEAEAHFPSRLLGALVSDPPLADFGQPFQPLELIRSRLLETPTSYGLFNQAESCASLHRSVS